MASHALRSTGKDVTELNGFVLSLVRRINEKYSKGTYKPIVWLDRPVPLYEKIALYSVADVAVVAATRDGMNLVPYEYIVCREGPEVHACPSQTPYARCSGKCNEKAQSLSEQRSMQRAVTAFC